MFNNYDKARHTLTYFFYLFLIYFLIIIELFILIFLNDVMI